MREMGSVDEHDRVEWNLTNHTPNPEQVDAIETVRDYAKKLGHTITSMCPPTRERSLALTKLEEATMFAVAAIAREK